ncbi:MAG: PTS sugar transporter subunit IIA [Lacrimispora sp.]
MKKDMLFRELVQLDWEAADQTEVFERIADILFKNGFVKDTYLESLKVREANYPTALPIEPYPVAIPHTDIGHIIRPFIAPIRLKKPVEWREMANNDVIHQVRFIFMLGFLKSDEHVELLQVLVENFQNEELMEHLKNAETADEYFRLVCGMNGME